MGDFHNESRPVARKEHQCWQCQGLIPKGRVYRRATGMYEGYFFDTAEHFECHRAWSAFNWSGRGPRRLSAYEDADALHADTELEEREWIVEWFPLAADNLGWLDLNAPIVWC